MGDKVGSGKSLAILAAIAQKNYLDNINVGSLIVDSGFSIANLPNLEDYSDFFTFTVDNIPFPSVVGFSIVSFNSYLSCKFLFA